MVSGSTEPEGNRQWCHGCKEDTEHYPVTLDILKCSDCGRVKDTSTGQIYTEP